MKRSRLVIASLVVLIGTTGAANAAQSAGAVPTFTKDVAPILFSKCVLCHRPGEVAPMSLMTYENARPWAKAIKDKVVRREMPPWIADPSGSVKFRNDRSLTDAQIATIAAWADGGAPKGNESDLPPLPKFTEGWVFGEPDAVFQMPTEFDIPAEGEIPTLNFYSAVPFTEDRFLEAVEMRPTNYAVVHHANVTFITLPNGVRVVDGQALLPDGQPVPRERVVQDADSRTAGASQFISYVPGRGYEAWPAGVGRRVQAGKFLVWSVHYQASGRPEKDRTRIGVYFAKTPVTKEVYRTDISDSFPTETGQSRGKRLIAEGKEIRSQAEDEEADGGIPPIPPYADNWKLTAVMPILEPITIYAFQPHFHLRAKDVKYVVTYPDGREQAILTVPHYNFNWQLHYELDQPLKIPAGSKVTSIVHFDNSLKNEYNPAPHLPVYWSEQSWDEMYSPKMHFTVDSQDMTKTKSNTQQQQQQQQQQP